MSALSLILEDFETAGAELAEQNSARAQQMRAAAYAEGYAAGETAAASRREADIQFLHGVADKIDDALQDNTGQLKAQFCDALKTAIEKVFPSIAEKGFADAAALSVAEAVNIHETDEIVLKVAPSRQQLVEDALRRHGADETICVETDTTITNLGAKAEWRNAGLEIDIDVAIRQCLSALEHTITQITDEAEK